MYKINFLTYKTLNGLAPKYLQNILEYENQTRQTRSTHMQYLKKARSNTKDGDRAFYHEAPQLWNTLPLSTSPKLQDFKKKLKTFYFEIAFKN